MSNVRFSASGVVIAGTMAAGRVHARGPTLLVLACALSSGRSDDIQPAVTGSALVSELGACETEACASAALDASGGAVQSLPPADIETVAVDLVSRSFWEPAHALLDIARAVGVPVAQFDRLRRQLTREREEVRACATRPHGGACASHPTSLLSAPPAVDQGAHAAPRQHSG